MDKELISHDPLLGLSTYHSYDAETDTSVFSYEGDPASHLDLNKRLANDAEVTRQGIKDEFWLYASIPAIVQMKLLTEKGIDVWNPHHRDRLSKVLEDPEYRYLKTTNKIHRMK